MKWNREQITGTHTHNCTHTLLLMPQVGQHLALLNHVLPHEYTDTLTVLQDQVHAHPTLCVCGGACVCACAVVRVRWCMCVCVPLHYLPHNVLTRAWLVGWSCKAPSRPFAVIEKAFIE